MKCLSQTIDLGKEDNLSIISQKKRKEKNSNKWMVIWLQVHFLFIESIQWVCFPLICRAQTHSHRAPSHGRAPSESWSMAHLAGTTAGSLGLLNSVSHKMCPCAACFISLGVEVKCWLKKNRLGLLKHWPNEVLPELGVLVWLTLHRPSQQLGHSISLSWNSLKVTETFSLLFSFIPRSFWSVLRYPSDVGVIF